MKYPLKGETGRSSHNKGLNCDELISQISDTLNGRLSARKRSISEAIVQFLSLYKWFCKLNQDRPTYGMEVNICIYENNYITREKIIVEEQTINIIY